MLFDVLHGKSIAVMADTLEMVIAENTAYHYVAYTEGHEGLYSRHSTAALLDYQETHGALPTDFARVRQISLAAFKASLGQCTRAVVLVESLSLVRPGAIDNADPFYAAPPF
jgi:hypothetical protein